MVFLFSRILSARPMSRSQVVFRRRFVCDGIIYYNITCSFVYPVTVLRKFRRGCPFKSDMNSGDLASNCKGRLSIGNLQGHTPWVLDCVPITSHIETKCIIQDHHISDSSQIFSGWCTSLFQAALQWASLLIFHWTGLEALNQALPLYPTNKILPGSQTNTTMTLRRSQATSPSC